MIKKLPVTYRATIDRRVPIEVRSRTNKKRGVLQSKIHFIKNHLRFI